MWEDELYLPSYDYTATESVFDPTYGGSLPLLTDIGESVFDPSYGGTLPDTPEMTWSKLQSLAATYGTSALNSLKGMFTKPASQGGGVDWRAVATAGGALLPLLQGNSTPRPTGYQGGIPQYSAVRQQVAPAAGRRPGAGGQRYFTDVQYVPTTGDGAADALTAAQTAATQEAQGLASLNAASPLNAPPVAYQPSTAPVAAPAAPAYNPEYSGANVLKTVQGLLAGKQMARGGIVNLQDGGFVVPADVVSHLGNGSSDAGLRHLAQKGAVPIKGQGDGMSDSNRTNINGKQPAAVADGEAYFGPREVENLGGAERLYSMMDRIRKDRTGTTKQGRQINPNQYLG